LRRGERGGLGGCLLGLAARRKRDCRGDGQANWGEKYHWGVAVAILSCLFPQMEICSPGGELQTNPLLSDGRTECEPRCRQPAIKTRWGEPLSTK
jgi:hypothetical protein